MYELNITIFLYLHCSYSIICDMTTAFENASQGRLFAERIRLEPFFPTVALVKYNRLGQETLRFIQS